MRKTDTKLLRNCQEQIPTLAQWFNEEWGHLKRNRTPEIIKERLRQSVLSEGFPFTLVGFLEERPVATATLKFREMSTHLHLDHWLGTVYVLPEYRRRGLGSEIVAAAVHLARTLEIKTLYLFTPDQERMYRRLGWIPIEFTRYDERNVVIMKRDLHTLQSGI